MTIHRSLLTPRALIVISLLQLFPAIAQTPAPAVDKTVRKVTIGGTELLAVSFDKLSSFSYKIVDAGTGATPDEIAAAMKTDQVPDWIKVYNNKQILLTGYMMPLQLENGRAKKFVIMRDINTCCYGAVPNMNDYVMVTMKGAGVENVQDVPVELTGTFRIEQKYEGGYIVGLFALDGDKFLGAKK